ncbi:MAG: Glutamine-dependent NAD(+) synthetase [Deltaproteobacteria bacterium ADurb.Bin510]|nr:MAG: Glutamine-dependent NAD(+) synthetase [Deltaproteobacteria bacterium ADurb.Bin510]
MPEHEVAGEELREEHLEQALERLLEASLSLKPAFVVGAPLVIDASLYNCGVVIQGGRILGVALKSYPPNHREFYELRQFAPAGELVRREIELCGQRVPVGADLIFDVVNVPGLSFFAEICEDVWVALPPSTLAALAGASVVVNLSASNITVGKDEYRHALTANQSARTLSAYVYTAAGPGESTTDLAWDGQALIYENGVLLAESRRFVWEPQLVTADVDLERLRQERGRTTSFGANRRAHQDMLKAFRHVSLELELPEGPLELERAVARFPYVPSDRNLRAKRCGEVYDIQVQGLAKRLRSSGIDKLVIGVSGGLDSTQALIVAAHTMDELKLPRTNIKAYTMPGFATSSRTYNNALSLMRSLGVATGEIDIRPSSLQMMQDIGHPYAEGQERYDVTFENIQAGERTSHLFRLANQLNALVVGTGDLSELALGWCTYGVGDHMSHYNVNASVPKTLIQYLIRFVAEREQFGPAASACLLDILATEISPELVPGSSGGEPHQKTEDIIGPYELQDFNTYYATRYGFTPVKIAYLALNAWQDVSQGTWPDVPLEKRHQYSLAEIKTWLKVFVQRFYGASQYKRSCVPNGPKVGSGGSLSPRGDWRVPSDAEAAVWLRDLERIPAN